MKLRNPVFTRKSLVGLPVLGKEVVIELA